MEKVKSENFELMLSAITNTQQINPVTDHRARQIRQAEACSEVMDKKIADLIDGYDEWSSDVRRLSKEIDVIMNGIEGSAQSPSLCDVVSQLKDWKSDNDRKMDVLKIALLRIIDRNEHTAEFSMNQGSNGVRDFYRDIAVNALTEFKNK